LRGSGTVWGATEAVSSNENVLGATNTGSRTSLSYNVNVTQTAAGQRSSSQVFDSEETNSFQAGENAFTLTTGGRTFNITADIDEEDTNEEALNRIAGAINEAGSGVRAQVITDDEGSRLQLTGLTGERNAFELTEVNGDTIEISDSQEARDAMFTVQGQQFTSETNNVQIAGGRIELELRGTGQATVSSRQDTARASESISEFVTAYNESMRNLNNLPASSQSNRLQSQLNISGSQSRQLNNIGVTVNSDRTLSINSERLTEALREDPDNVRSQIAQLANQATEASRNALNLRNAPRNTSQMMNFLMNGMGGGRGGLVLDLFT
jgi:flagellar hook-associated protein 2